MRQLRGAVLRELLGGAPPDTMGDLRNRVAHLPASADEGAVAAAVTGLQADGLLRRDWPAG
jgi:hypothetical protein